MEKLQTTACESSEQVVHIESELSGIKEENDRLIKALDAVKENSDRQVRELERENEQLSQTLDSIRERSEKTSDAKVIKDLEQMRSTPFSRSIFQVCLCSLFTVLHF